MPSLSKPLVVLACLALAAVSHGGEFDQELTDWVRLVRQELGDASKLYVDPFRDLTSRTPFSGEVRTGLRESFMQECRRQGFEISDSADHILLGEFYVTDIKELKAGKPLKLEIAWKVVDRQRKTKFQASEVFLSEEVTTSLSDPAFLAAAVGVVGAIEPPSPSNESVSQLLQNPSGAVSGAKIRSGPNSPYEVIVESRAAGSGAAFRPCPASAENGHPFVEIPEGHEYRLRVVNHSLSQVAISTFIDGLSTFHFSDDSYRDPETGKLSVDYYIFKAASETADGQIVAGEGLVPGWQLSASGADNVSRFLLTDYGDSAAGALGIPEGQDAGAIHMRFCQLVRTRGDGTAQGERFTQEFNHVSARPLPPTEFLTIRYSR